MALCHWRSSGKEKKPNLKNFEEDSSGGGRAIPNVFTCSLPDLDDINETKKSHVSDPCNDFIY